MHKKSLESLLFGNGGIKNLSCFSIYKTTCKKLQKCLDGCIDTPLIILNLFVHFHADKVFESKLKNPGKIKTVSKLLQSILVVDSEEGFDQEKVHTMLNEARTYLDLMNEIFPLPILEAKFEVSNQIYLNLKSEFSHWLKDQILVVDKVSGEIKPNNLDQLIIASKGCISSSSYQGNEDMWNMMTHIVGGIINTRSKMILQQQFGTSLQAKTTQDIQNVLDLSSAMYAIRNLSIFTLEDQIKDLYGIYSDLYNSYSYQFKEAIANVSIFLLFRYLQKC